MSASAARKGTLLSALEWGASELKNAGKPSPRLDAELILSNLMGIERIRLYIEFESPIAAAESREYMSRIRRRAGGEPVAYLTGIKEFYSRVFEVNRHVLIPRPETECVVDAVLASFGRPGAAASPRILDLCTGSGCIAVTIACELSGAAVTASDISAEALEVAARNAEKHRKNDSIAFLEGNLFEPLAGNRFDVIVSNPPYIPTAMISELQDEIRFYEPVLALDGGVDGLDFIDRLVQAAPDHLVPGGRLIFEISEFELEEALRLAAGTGRYSGIEPGNDLSGRPRFVSAVLKG